MTTKHLINMSLCKCIQKLIYVSLGETEKTYFQSAMILAGIVSYLTSVQSVIWRTQVVLHENCTVIEHPTRFGNDFSPLQWTSLFQNELKTEEKSLVFVKRMMALAVSSITYLRGIFPEDAYRSRYLEGDVRAVKVIFQRHVV